MTNWLNDDEQRAWRNLIAVTTLLPSALDAQLRRDSELTNFDYWILAMLSETPERVLRMSDLADRSNSSLSRLSHAVGRLEERGYVVRSPLADDGRVNVATLTDAGWAKVVETAPGHVECVRSIVFDGLTSDQVAQMEAICGAILDRLTSRTEPAVR
ncbi:MAG: MarR family winged helix-turn-helix transcriptional regulator [Acidimicrobiia bacterium]|nr:MarR family winged helix-turn-helix transcriptional regulator [Acidimicrobiia bacterium]